LLTIEAQNDQPSDFSSDHRHRSLNIHKHLSMPERLRLDGGRHLKDRVIKDLICSIQGCYYASRSSFVFKYFA
jgi:hypothetical protein